MIFEFDPEKSASNKLKHGIDFEEAQKLWLDPNRLTIRAKSETESRFAIVAEFGGKNLVGILHDTQVCDSDSIG